MIVSMLCIVYLLYYVNKLQEEKKNQSFQNFLREHAPKPSSISLADIIISLWK